MAPLKAAARPLLASVFLASGWQTLRHPELLAPAAAPVALAFARRVPWLPADAERLVRMNGAVDVGAGALLATGRVPRLAALALAASLVPTTIAGHPFWSEDDPGKRIQQRIQFLKNLSILGGLLMTVAAGREERHR
ncbi:DoxX family protein [Streptomyces sp. NPDC049577]|uniref:DoxX family protein n=1 Tax=Streptomyces sp. NPDC049577 TaxID=3155153 RepID=UPI003419377C